MKTKKLDMNGIITSLFEILVGILLLINPVGLTSGIIIASGVILCVFGIKSAFTYFRTDAKQASKSQELSKGLVCLLIGLFCAFKSGWFIATFPILTVIYGVIMLLTGLGKVQCTVDMFRLKSKHWYLAAISAVVSLLCAITVLMNPFSSTTVLWMFTGVTLIVESMLDIVTVVLRQAKDGE